MLSQKRLVDKMIEAYVAWREACLIVSDAYDAWTRESTFWASLAFEDYSAALDREENAAEIYAGLVRRVARLVSRDQRRIAWLEASAAGESW